MGGKKRVKNLTKKIFTLICFSKEQPVSSSEIREKFNLSKQALYYHTKKLLDSGFIKETMKDYCSFYEPTENGKTVGVKKLSVGVIDQLIGLHNIGFKFKILSGKDFTLKRTTHLRGWKKYHCSYKGCYVEKTPSHLIIVPFLRGERMYGTDPFELQNRATSKAISVAQDFVDRYDLRLSDPEICRKPHFAVQDPLTKFFKQEITTDEEKADDSEGTGGERDIFTPQKAKAYFALPGKVDRMEETMEKMVELMGEQNKNIAVFAEHMKSHSLFIEKSASILKSLDTRLKQRRMGEFF